MRRRMLLTVLAADLGTLALAFVVASVMVFDSPIPWHAPLHGEDSIVQLMAAMVVGAIIGSYLSLRMWHRGVPRPAYGRAIMIIGTAVIVTMASIVITRGYWSRPYLFWTAVVWSMGALLVRVVLRRLPWTESVVIVTGDKDLVAALEDVEHLDILAVLDPQGPPPGEPVPGATLALDLRSVLSDDMAQFVASWSLAGAPTRALTSVYEEHTGRLPIMHINHGWELTAPVERNDYEPFKRVADVVAVGITAPLWLALGAIIWMAVRLDSAGAALYRQTRVGRGGKEFTLYKFRTMRHDAEVDGPQMAALDDPRFTRMGRLLRRFRLDEMPQLWNVLRGDLSLVGPRPERPYFVAQFERKIPFYSYRLLVRPGVTGWAQVNYGYADDVADTIEKLTYDLYYLKHMSFWLDLQIMGRSVWTVLSGFGAR